MSASTNPKRSNIMPRYAALIYSSSEAPGTPEEMATVMAEYMAFGEAAGAAGVIAAAEQLYATTTATTIQRPNGKDSDVVHTDGPFAETKEVFGGFYLLDCADLDEALNWAGKIPGSWHGRVEVRPCVDFSGGQ
jgi:hypothetical protein